MARLPFRQVDHLRVRRRVLSVDARGLFMRFSRSTHDAVRIATRFRVNVFADFNVSQGVFPGEFVELIPSPLVYAESQQDRDDRDQDHEMPGFRW
jgi:hypothetical protein